LGQDALAIATVSHAIQQRPDCVWAWRINAAASALTGDLVAARKALTNMRRLLPAWDISEILARHPGASTNHGRLLEGLRLLEAPDN